GTMQAFERWSSGRTRLATSSGRIMDAAGMRSLKKSVKGVSTKDGHTAHDRIPIGPSSFCMAWVKAMTAAFDAEYTDNSALPSCPLTEEVFTTRARPRSEATL